MNEFKELEYKYKADDVKLTDFVNLMINLIPTKRKDVSSWDHYYTSVVTKDAFIRFRESDNPELTMKRKIQSSNNWERLEIDLPLDPNRIKINTVNKWAEMEDYKHNFTIYKSCFIFWYDIVNTVYYVVYNEDMKEVGRFIEVEVNKEQVDKLGVDACFEKLKDFEKALTALGISPQNRLKKSLFEMFVKNEEKNK